MKNIVRLIVVLASAFFCESIHAQQEPLYSQYAFNTLSINPGYAGTKGVPTAAVISRFQWVGFDDGAPITHSAVFHMPLADRLGLGGSVVQDNQGPTKQFYGNVDVAYHLPLSEKSNLSLGLKAGFAQFRTDFDKLILTDENDNLLSGVQSEMKPNIGAGAYYFSDKMYVGFSVPRLLESEFNENVQQLKRHYFLVGGYLAKLSQIVQFRPTFLIRSVTGAPYELDLTPSFIIHDKFMIGATYRTTPEVGAILQYWFKNGLKIGYAYDYPLNALNQQTSGSHEIMVGFDFNKLKKISGGLIKNYSPRYF